MAARDNRPLRVALRGGIGSGKSTVAEMLRRRGAVVIEADRLGHEVLEPGGEAHDAVARRWPQAVVDGRIDRGRLAAIVFADADELAELERLTHPHIAARIERLAAGAGDRPVVVELPVAAPLVGEGWIDVVVEADPELRLERAVSRGMDRDDVARRMARQPAPAEWRSFAVEVIDNSGDLARLEAAVDDLWRRLGGDDDR